MSNDDLTRRTALVSHLSLLPLLIGVCVGLYTSNPAFALLGGVVTRLWRGTHPIPQGKKLSNVFLQTAIVLLGFRLSWDQLTTLSLDFGVAVSVFVAAAFGLGIALGTVLRNRTGERTLLSSGTAICGGTAIATVAPVIDADSRDVGVSLALVFLLNAVALFTFPTIGSWLELSQQQFGAWVALAVHDTSSVVATAAIYGNEAAEVATTLKLGRTLWLVPLTLLLSFMHGRKKGARARIPLFVFLFVAAVVAGSWIGADSPFVAVSGRVSKALLVLALALIGLNIDRTMLRQLSPRTLVYAVGLWLLVIPLALGIVMYL